MESLLIHRQRMTACFHWLWWLGLGCGLGVAGIRAELVVISEIMFHPQGAQPEYFILRNNSATPLDLAQWRVTEGVAYEFPAFSTNDPAASFWRPHERLVLSSANPATTRSAYALPATTRVFGPWVGKLSNEGERLTVRDKNGALVCTVKYGVGGHWPAADGVGHALVLKNPDGSLDEGRNWTAGREPKPPLSGAGQPLWTSGVIINEIMFDPPPGAEGGEFVELFNRGMNTVDLSGWALSEGVRFPFPPGTKISVGGFLVVASDTNALRAAHGDIPMTGNFAGKIRHRGETIRLVDASGNSVGEVDFKTGGDWPQLAKGGGSSLELAHPWMDAGRASAWRDSDESGKAAFRSYATTNTYLESNPLGEPSDYRELHLHLAGDGHVALRHIALLKDGTNLILHGARLSTNGSGDQGWLVQGTHGGSWITNGELHLIADGHGDDRGNHAELDVPGLRPNETYALTFEARWISGMPRLIAETWDHSFGHSFLLKVPGNLGTPGRVNSRWVAAPLPQVDGLRHQPAVPRPADTVTISARIFSADPLKSVRVFHRADSVAGTNAWESASMESAGEGVYAAKLSGGKTNGAVTQFYVEALARNGQAAALPRDGAARPALFVVDDRALPGGLRTARLVMAARDLEAIARGGTAAHGYRYPRRSNHYFNATLIAEETEIFYGADARNSGSPRTRGGDLRKVKLKLPADRAWRGRTKFSFDDDAAGGTAYHNRVARYLLYLLGHPASENEFMRVVVNAGAVELREEVEPVGREFLERNFVGGQHGELYRIDDAWRFVDSGEGLNEDAEWSYADGADASRHRHEWMKRTREAEDDFSRLTALFQTMSRTNFTAGETDALLDPQAVATLAAVRGFIGDWDSFTMQRGRNGYLYRRPGDGLFQFLHWDSDEAFVTGQPLYGERLRGWMELPEHRQIFFGRVRELLRLCVDEPSRFRTWLELEREASGPAVRQATYLNFFKARAPEVRAAMGEPLPAQVKAGLNPPR